MSSSTKISQYFSQWANEHGKPDFAGFMQAFDEKHNRKEEGKNGDSLKKLANFFSPRPEVNIFLNLHNFSSQLSKSMYCWMISNSSVTVTLLGNEQIKKAYLVNALLEKSSESYQSDASYRYAFTTSFDPLDFPFGNGTEKVIINASKPVHFSKDSSKLYNNASSFDKVKKPFLLPDNIECYHVTFLKYGKVPELVIHFISEERLRDQFQFIICNLRENIGSNLYRLLRTSVSWCTLAMTEDEIALRFKAYKSSDEVPIKPELASFLSNLMYYRGTGNDLQSDRHFIRERLYSLLTEYAFFIDAVTIKFPSTFLEPLKHFAICQPFDFLCKETIDHTSVLLLGVRDGGVTSNVSSLVRDSEFLENFVRSPETHRFAIVDLHANIFELAGKKSDEPTSSHPNKYVLSRLNAPKRQNYVALYKSFLPALLNESPSFCDRPRSQIDRAVKHCVIIIASSYYFSTSTYHTLSEYEWTGIPTVYYLIENFVISQSSKKVFNFCESWMKRRNPRGARKYISSSRMRAKASSSSSSSSSSVSSASSVSSSASSASTYSSVSSSSSKDVSMGNTDAVDELVEQMEGEFFVGESRKSLFENEKSIKESFAKELTSWKSFFENTSFANSALVFDLSSKLFEAIKSKSVYKNANSSPVLLQNQPNVSTIETLAFISLPSSFSGSDRFQIPFPNALRECWEEIRVQLLHIAKSVWNEEIVKKIGEKERALHETTQRVFQSVVVFLESKGLYDESRKQIISDSQTKTAQIIVKTLSELRSRCSSLKFEEIVSSNVNQFSSCMPTKQMNLVEFLAPLYSSTVSETFFSLGKTFAFYADKEVHILCKTLTSIIDFCLELGPLSMNSNFHSATFQRVRAPSFDTLSSISRTWVVFDGTSTHNRQNMNEQRNPYDISPNFQHLPSIVAEYSGQINGAKQIALPFVEQEHFLERLKSASLSLSLLTNDTNSLFRALSHLLNFEEEGFPIVRLIVMNELLVNYSSLYESYFNSFLKFQKYINNFINDSISGDFLSLYAFTNATRFALVILSPRNEIPFLISPSAMFKTARSKANALKDTYVKDEKMNTEMDPQDSNSDLYVSSSDLSLFLNVPFLACALTGSVLTPITYNAHARAEKRSNSTSNNKVFKRHHSEKNMRGDKENSEIDEETHYRVEKTLVQIVSSVSSESALNYSQSNDLLSSRIEPYTANVPVNEALINQNAMAKTSTLLPKLENKPQFIAWLVENSDQLNCESFSVDILNELIHTLSLHHPIDGIDFDRVLSILLRSAFRFHFNANTNRSILSKVCVNGSPMVTNFTCAFIVSILSEPNFGQVDSTLSFLSIHTLDLSRSPFLSDEGVSAIIRGIPNLNTLILEECVLVSDQAWSMLSSEERLFVNLEVLSISRCNRITNAGIPAIASFPKLKSLNVSHCRLITSVGLNNLKNLTSLDVSYCSAVDDSFFVALPQFHTSLISLKANASTASDSMMASSLSKIKTLQTLHLSSTSACVQTLTAIFSNSITELVLADCKGITSDVWTLAFEKSRIGGIFLFGKLSHLDLSGCFSLSVSHIISSYNALGMKVTPLSVLSLSRMQSDENALTSLINCCPNITVFDVANCGKNVGDNVARALSFVTQNSLTKVSFTSTAISDVGVSIFSTCCPSLRLFACSLTKVTDEGIIRLCSCCTLLETLVVEHLNLTDISIRVIAKKCHRLEHLSIAHNKNITDNAIHELAGLQDNAVEMTIEEDNDKNNTSAHILQVGCQKLISLDISNTNVTKTGLFVCLTSFPELVSLVANSINLNNDGMKSGYVIVNDRIKSDNTNGNGNDNTNTNGNDRVNFHLRNLSLCWNHSLCDGLLADILSFSPLLKNLSLSYCPKLTLNSIIVICKRMDLTSLSIKGIKNLSEHKSALREKLVGKDLVIYI